MTGSRRRAQRAAVVVAVATLVLAGCTSVVPGHGRVLGTSAAGPTSGASSAGPPAPSTPASSAQVNQFSTYARTPIITAIGDPVTADLCSAIGVGALQGVAPGADATVDELQYPPGCSMTLRKGGHPLVGISVFATQGEPTARHGRTTRTVSGQAVFVYPFDRTTGDCERAIVVGSVVLDVDAFADTAANPDKVLYCGGTDAMSTRLAEVVAGGNVARIGIADPSLSTVNSCAVVRASNVASLSLFATARIEDEGLGASCELRPTAAFVFVNYVIDAAPLPRDAVLKTIGGHPVYAASSNGQSFCSFVSVQGTTSDGKHEEVSVSANASDASNPPASMCAQTGQLLAAYLDTVGLR